MNKNLLHMLQLAAAAYLALAASACVKITDQSPDVAIDFDTAIGKQTKAVMTTTEYTDAGFYVSAYRNGTQLYFQNALAQKADTEWKATNFMCFWPLSGQLDFTAFSPYTAVDAASVDNLRISGNGVIQADSYSITTAEDMGRDFCYATASRLDCSTDKSVVDMVFHHALSLICVTVTPDETGLVNGSADGLHNEVSFTVDNVYLENVKSSATFYYDAASTSKNHWSSHSDVMTYDITAPEGDTGVAFLMIPQTLVPEAAIKVEYTVTQIVKNGETVVRTIVTKHEGSANIGVNTPAWEENKKIVYDLVISPLHPIVFTAVYNQDEWVIVDDYIFQY